MTIKFFITVYTTLTLIYLHTVAIFVPNNSPYIVNNAILKNYKEHKMSATDKMTKIRCFSVFSIHIGA